MIIFTADDFGSSKEVNAAIIQAYREGTLHAASLMMGEASTREAVELAKANPGLRVGLHLVLTDGKSVLPAHKLRALVDSARNFTGNPASAWLSYLFKPWATSQLEQEVKAQFDAFRMSGLKLSHVDGHHHLHIHPKIWNLVVEQAKIHGADWVRLPREDLAIWKEAAADGALWKRAHVKVYHFLTAGKISQLKKEGFLSIDGVFGIAETFSMTREYVLRILKKNPPGIFEFYFHPGKNWNRDLDILLDTDVIREAKKFGLADPWKIRP